MPQCKYNSGKLCCIKMTLIPHLAVVLCSHKINQCSNQWSEWIEYSIFINWNMWKSL